MAGRIVGHWPEEMAQRLVFVALYKGAVLASFIQDFGEVLELVFPISLKIFLYIFLG